MSKLLQSLLEIRSPSGEEFGMKQFIMDYVESNSGRWKTKPEIIADTSAVQDCLVLVFGKPKVAAFAHLDTTGFTVRYQDQLIPIGSPEVNGGEKLVGTDRLGDIDCDLILLENGHARYQFGRGIESGTSLVYKSNFQSNETQYISPYLDNRIGIYNLLKLAEHIEHGALVFSCWEEHGGGSVPFLVRLLYEKYNINKMLVSDVTWVTDGVALGKGVVVSYRDVNIPRRSFIEALEGIISEMDIQYQIEVEAYGSSDAREIQQSPYPIDWCFIGPPVENAHSNAEKIAKSDLEYMMAAYRLLVKKL